MRYLASLLVLVLLSIAAPVSAHEVYVLSQDAITAATAAPPFSSVDVLIEHLDEFIFWAFIGVLTVFVVFFASISRVLESALDPFLMRLRPFAPVVSRVTIGLSFLAAAWFQAAFGPELPLPALFGAYTPLVTGLLVTIGILITLGYFTRTAALVAFGIFLVAVWKNGSYMLTYASYLGEIVVLLILGGHRAAIHADASRPGRGFSGFLGRIAERIAPYSFIILRVAFGISLLYASLYAKFLHNMLALDVAVLPLAGHAYGLAHYLGFEPHFLVLGAGIVEIVIALFFILGIEIRFTALFLEFWLALSLFFFGEVVWPHLILIGIPIAFMLYGYDKYSLEGRFFRTDDREPVL